MPTQPVPVTPAPAAPAKVSWLKKIGNVLGKILKIVAKDAAPAADTAAKVAAVMFPQFAPEISAADNLFDAIAREALTAEVMDQAAAQAKGGPAKLQAVLGTMGPAIDEWVKDKFPGANAVSNAAKAGLVNAVVYLMNEVAPPAGIGAPAN
jgi:hypothetical protein